MITFNHDHARETDGVFRGRLKFPNGWEVSWVGGFGAGNGIYSAHADGKFTYITTHTWSTVQSFESVEVGIFNPQGELVPFASGDTVKGWVKATELVEIFAWVAKQS